jgi:hypothetical protein
MLLEPVVDLDTRTRATEPAAFLAVLEQDHGREAAHPIVSGQTHVFARVDLDLGQSQTPGVFLDDALQMRRERVTGTAPVGPEIDQDRLLGRGRNDLGLKVLVVDLEDGRMGRRGRRHEAVTLEYAKSLKSIGDPEFEVFEQQFVAADQSGLEGAAGLAQQPVRKRLGLCATEVAAHPDLGRLDDEFGTLSQGTGGDQRIGLLEQQRLDARQRTDLEPDAIDTTRPVLTGDVGHLIDERLTE